MPYDPRPVSQGGNRGIDEKFSRKAPEEGKFRVVSVDTFDGSDMVEGDFPSLEEAKIYMKENTEGREMLLMYIFDDQGRSVGRGGTF